MHADYASTDGVERKSIKCEKKFTQVKKKKSVLCTTLRTFVAEAKYSPVRCLLWPVCCIVAYGVLHAVCCCVAVLLRVALCCFVSFKLCCVVVLLCCCVVVLLCVCVY